MTLSLHPDWHLRHEVVVAYHRSEASLRQLAAQQRRVAREEPQHAAEDRKKRMDGTASIRCVRCGKVFAENGKRTCTDCSRARRS